jgi:translation initiation factor IF-3
MLRETALSLADRQGLDLVLISPSANPPVAKVMDFGKYRYDQQKREKEAKKKQKIIEIKEIRLGTFIEQHDLEIKGNMAKKFLADGDKLKVSLRFKGRERGRTDRGFEVMKRFAEFIKEYGTPEKLPVLEGRSLIMIVNPLPPKKEKPEKAEGSAETEAKQTDADPGEAKQTEVKQAEVKQAEVKQAEAEQAEVKQAETKQATQGEGDEAKPKEQKQKKAKGPSDEMDL